MPAAPALRAQVVTPVPRAGSAVADSARTDAIPLSLDDAVARALRLGDEVQQAETAIDATNAQVTVARSAALPQLRFAGNYQQVLENARATIVGSVFGQSYTYQANATLSQPVFQGGRVVGGLRAASRLRAATRLDLDEARAQLSVDVQRAYLGARAADQLVGIQERNLQLSTERVAQAEQLERAGRAARYDVLRARVERTNLEPLLIQARNDRELAYLELRRLLNLPTDRPLRLTTTVAQDSSAVEAVLRSAEEMGRDAAGRATAAGTPDEAAPVGERAAVRSAEATVDARRASIRVARADFLPTVNVSLTSGFLALPTTAGFPTRLGRSGVEFCPAGSPATRICQNNGFFADRSFRVDVAWPLFDGLRAKGNLDLAQAQARTAELQLAQTRERVAVEAAQARAAVERARALYAAQRANATDAEEAFRLATLRFQRGLGTQLEVSDAQLALLTAQTNALRATYDVYLAAAEQARALGRPIPTP
ncbi:TolC family protein [Roseisolibacter sp. H3M3-2]|uniref:TolC family protein n=1 Tax=Roseisolibacter sp. H3M3-2 TaxID=3031323 RepID=UPI0023DB8AEC|nr:TolC family protein [Roseisolibacter sp. H3M3-2]MDF1504731.1 TolC family protein [Roseisolibacter sp. H3M3-2]